MKRYRVVLKGNDVWQVSYHITNCRDFEEAYENVKIALAQYQKQTIEVLRIYMIEEL